MLCLRVLSRRNLSHLSRRCNSNSCLINRLEPLYLLFPTPVLCFQQLAASFPKTPGVGVAPSSTPLCLPVRQAGRHLPRPGPGSNPDLPPVAKGCNDAEAATLTTFSMNTCKSVSKQTTLTIFRMNTYEKQGEGGTPADRRLTLTASLLAAPIICAT
jgi:hypothetical protein